MIILPRSPSASIVSSERSPCTSRSFARLISYLSSVVTRRASSSHVRGTLPVVTGACLLGLGTDRCDTWARVDEPTAIEETEALEASQPTGDRGRDQRILLGNTGQNVLGLAIGALATFAAQVIITRRLGDEGFGVVTLTTQFAFIAAAATRFGMDVANVRLVARLVGRAQAPRARGLVRRSVAIAAAISVSFGVAVFLLAPWLAAAFSGRPAAAEGSFRAAAFAIPVCALAFTYMGAT